MIGKYKELIDEIDILTIRIEGLKREKELLIKKMQRGPSEVNSIDYSGMPRGSQEYKSLIRYVEDIQRLDSLIYIDSELLDIKKETIEKIENKINSMPGIEHKVAFLSAKGKNLKEIADMLGYSYQHIRRIHARLYSV